MLAAEASAQSFSQVFERAFPHLTFAAPVALRVDPSGSDWLFVGEQDGTIRTFPESDGADEAFLVLDISDRVLGSDVDIESGLLALALHPAFADNGYIFTYYITHINGQKTARLSRFTTSGIPAVADPDSELVLIELEREDLKHNGGDLHFSDEGYLFASFGDGFCCGDPLDNGQDRTNLFSTIIRIDVDSPQNGLPYGIPADNPFAGNTEGWREEIWAYGLRNPWRFAFHPETGEIWVGDVGELGYEEVNRIVPGGNYGWSIMEGPECFEWPPGSGQGTNCDTEGLIPPVWYYGRDVGISVTGGYFYRGERRADLHGRYIFADWGSQHVFVATVDDQAQHIIDVERIVDGDAPFPPAFGEGSTGELYILGYFSGTIHRFEPRHHDEVARGRIGLHGPNPVATATRFRFETFELARVEVAVFDIVGRRISTLFNQDRQAPTTKTLEFHAATLASGTYFMALIMDGSLADLARFTVVGRRTR